MSFRAGDFVNYGLSYYRVLQVLDDHLVLQDSPFVVLKTSVEPVLESDLARYMNRAIEDIEMEEGPRSDELRLPFDHWDDETFQTYGTWNDDDERRFLLT